ncbi:hypothetical protein F4777DRAFT_582011 [Nemania sp. FL0916]|nr:hypothetical protein F4777DRAFT_582011 [Nemania sp. FL0916]
MAGHHPIGTPIVGRVRGRSMGDAEEADIARSGGSRSGSRYGRGRSHSRGNSTGDEGFGGESSYIPKVPRIPKKFLLPTDAKYFQRFAEKEHEKMVAAAKRDQEQYSAQRQQEQSSAQRQQEQHPAQRQQEHHSAQRQQEQYSAQRQQEQYSAQRQQEQHSAQRQQEQHSAQRQQEQHSAQRQQENGEDSGNEEVEETAGDLASIPGPSTRYLPECSYGKSKKTQVFSNAMMKAYVAMRGNWLGGDQGEDPLFAWIQQKDKLEDRYQPTTIRRERRVSRMLTMIDIALQSPNPRGDSPGDGLFEIFRPDVEHIKPPQGHDMSANEFSACCEDFEWSDGSDDDEADAPSGRISPCTFLAWSKGCVRWDTKATDKNKPDTENHTRTRPVPPEITIPTRPPARGLYPFMEFQRDENTGEELTPTYWVPTSPSIIYTPPGIDFEGFSNPNFQLQYKRMVPLVERELLEDLYGRRDQDDFPGLPPDGEGTLTRTEISRAASHIPEHNNSRGADVEALVRSQWDAVHAAEVAERDLQASIALQTARIDALKDDVRKLAAYLPVLAKRRDMQAARALAQAQAHAQAQENENRRGEAIRGYAAEQARDARARLDMATRRLEGVRGKYKDNEDRIKGLEDDVRGLCVRAGVRDPLHAYALLMGTEEQEFGIGGAGGVAGGGVGANTGNGYGYGVGAGAGAGADAGARGVGGAANAEIHAENGYGHGHGDAGRRFEGRHPDDEVREHGAYPGYGAGAGPSYNTRAHQNLPGPGHGLGLGSRPGPVPGPGPGTGPVPGGPLGQWSASSIGRAEEEFDRFAADRHMMHALDRLNGIPGRNGTNSHGGGGIAA